jgi:hypothetical protein
MLTSTRLRDHTGLAHATGQQGLADRVVHLMCAGVIQILAFKVNLRTATHLGPAAGVVHRAWPADKVFQFAMKLFNELGVLAIAIVGLA